VYVTQDSVYKVTVEADGNLFEYIEVREEGNTLRIREMDGYNLDPSRGIKVYVSAPRFTQFDASGACEIITQNQVRSTERIDVDLSGACDVQLDLNAPAVTVDASGASSIKLKGETKDLKLDGSGSVNFRCFDLMSESVYVGISGAGDAEVHASVKLDVSVSGAGSVKYKGNAAVNQSISGAGSVNKVN
jgi:hypothetical protein